MTIPSIALLTVLAATQRIAVVVGNNAGQEAHSLRFAEDDAGKMARALREVGGVRGDDLLLLQGLEEKDLLTAFQIARTRIGDWHRDPSNRVLLFFYFSGHSDGQALELGRDRVTFSELRDLLKATGAEVQVAIVDTCRSAAFFNEKGATASPGFDIRIDDDLSASGQVLLASSAANESAAESTAFGGSVFTHHFLAAIRGAADASGDGRVTLAEAYRFAYAHTLATTAATSFGAQHPAFDYRLSGQGELVLSELSSTGSTLTLPAGFRRALIVDLNRDQIIAEFPSDGARRVAIPPGNYFVRLEREGPAVEGRVRVEPQEERVLSWDELSPVAPLAGAAKGTMNDPTLLSLSVSGGALSGVGASLGPLVGGQLDIGLRDGLGLHAAIDGSSGSGSGFSESNLRLLVGYRFALRKGPLAVFAGPEMGVGVLWQSTGGESAFGAAAIEGGVRFHLFGPFALILSGQFAGELLREDGQVTVVAIPAGWLGLQAALNP